MFDKKYKKDIKEKKSAFQKQYERDAKELLYDPSKVRELVEETAEELNAIKEMEKKNQSIHRYVKKAYEEIMNDLGGEINASFIESELARRMANLSLIANNMETAMVYDFENFDFDRYIVLVRTQTVLGKTIGVRKRKKDEKDITLEDYISKLANDE